MKCSSIFFWLFSVEEHRKQFEEHRKQHYNEFEVVRLRRKEIEEELRALEREEQPSTTNDEKKEHRT